MIEWIHPDALDPTLKSGMEDYLLYLKTVNKDVRLTVHADWATAGHTADSQHYTGKAVDFHIEGMEIWAAWLALERFPIFKGIGYYPHWNSPGFHADVRIATYRARWIRGVDGTYLGFGQDALRQISSGVS